MDSLSPQERASMFQDMAEGEMSLRKGTDGVWTLTTDIGGQTQSVRAGQTITLKNRASHTEQNWLNLPATGMNFDEVRGYTDWLNKTGRVEGARPCTELEWERAARGADNRPYPHGHTLGQDEANFDETYDKDPKRMGPVEVGSFSASMSPFGLYNMAGNVYEWTASSLVSHNALARGGAYFYVKISSRTDNRTRLNRTLRAIVLGARVCADFAPAAH